MIALLQAAKEGRLDGVLVIDESRLARNDFVASFIRHQLKDAGVKIATPSRGAYDLSNPSDAFASLVVSGAHSLEQAMRSEKAKQGRRRAAEAGYWTGGPAPFGYRTVSDGKHKILEIDEDQAKVNRPAYDLIVNHGYSTYSATSYLNAKGYRTARDRLWRGPNLCWRLRQETIAGRWRYRTDGETLEVAIPAILSLEGWERLQRSIKGKPRAQSKHRLYPLTGRDRCHLRCTCDGNYFGKVDASKGTRSYDECSRNHHTFGDKRCPFYPRIIQSRKLDQAVWGEGPSGFD